MCVCVCVSVCVCVCEEGGGGKNDKKLQITLSSSLASVCGNTFEQQNKSLCHNFHSLFRFNV